MKRYILYIATLLPALIGAACSQDEAPVGDGRTGGMTMKIAPTRAEGDGQYDPLQYQQVFIYNSEGGLLRKYTEKENLPERLELLAGTYRAAVEVGEEVPADFTKRFYKGAETFTVKPGMTTPVEVVCRIANTVVEVKFDDTIAENLDPDYFVWVAGADHFDQAEAEAGRVPALKFTDARTGYYTLPAGTTSLAWKFSGTHVTGEAVEMEDVLADVKAGGKYVLTFKYSPDLPGYIEVLLIRVDPTTDDKDDEIIFSPDPTLLSEGFNNDELQKYVSGEKKYRIMAFAELKKFTVSIGDDSFDLLSGTPAGISLTHTDKYNTLLTLSDAFFEGRPGGDQAVTIHVEDANGGSQEITTAYRLQGLVPVTESSYDLWANTLTLRVVDFSNSANVEFSLRNSSSGNWQTLTGTAQGDDFITATFEPQWQTSTNANGLPIYTRVANTGVVATYSYDYKATISGVEKSGSFTAGTAQSIPNADMSGWSTTGGFAFPNAAGEAFWSSGNNSMTKTLCTSTDVKFGKAAPAAKLTSTNMLVLAAGNLFTGTFAYKSFTGTVQFGQPYDFTARPSAMKVKYHAKVGTVDKVRTSGDICPYISKGEQDKSRIYVTVIDWEKPHEVVSAMTTTKGAWDPERDTQLTEGKILGYGSLWITQTTEGDALQEARLDIQWYDKDTKPAAGNYSLIISCVCNAYGDYFTGCSTNVMYVDDFEWVY